MPTNLAIDDKLLLEAKKVGRFGTKRETVNHALQEFIQRRRQREILKEMGTIEFRSDWNYKEERWSRGHRR